MMRRVRRFPEVGKGIGRPTVRIVVVIGQCINISCQILRSSARTTGCEGDVRIEQAKSTR